MDILDEFSDSKENQGKYGFEYYKHESGFGSIIFDGDIDQLMNTAYESLGFTRVDVEKEMVDPELYPDDQCYAYRLPNTSLTAINDLFGRNFPMLVHKWNLLRKESAFELERIPNYRAINRVR